MEKNEQPTVKDSNKNIIRSPSRRCRFETSTDKPPLMSTCGSKESAYFPAIS